MTFSSRFGLLLLAATLVSCRTPSDLSTAAASPATPGVTRIALISDVHVTKGTNEAARIHPLRLAKVIEEVRAGNVDLVLVSGDLTEAGRPWELRVFRQKMAELERPVWFVPGNHDVGNKLIPGKTPGKGELSFRRLHDFEMQMGRSWWVREGAGVRVIGLNSGLYGSGTRTEQDMWRFLEQQLAASNALPTLIVQHHPPFLKKVDEKGGDYFNMEPYPRLRLLALAKLGGVKAVLSGHVHRGITNEYEGVLLYTTPPVAFGLPKNKQAEGWTLVTVKDGKVSAEFKPIPKIQ